MKRKYQSPAEKIYWYHFVGMKTSEMNNILNIWSISHVLEKYGLPADNGNNRGKLSDLISSQEEKDVAIEVIRKWIEEVASIKGDQYYGTELGFESLSKYFDTNYESIKKAGSKKERTQDEEKGVIDLSDEFGDESEDEEELEDLKPIHTSNFINEIELRNFKKIGDIKLELSNITCLVGRNNSGKSSILQALHFFLSLFKSGKIKFNQYESWVDINDLVYVPSGNLESINRYYFNANSNLSGAYESSLRIGYEMGDKLDISVTTNSSDSKVPANSLSVIMDDPASDIVAMYLESDQVSTVFVPGISGISDLEEMKVTPLVDELAAKGDSNSVLRNILYRASQMGDLWLDLLDKVSEIYGKKYAIEVFPKKTNNGYYIEANLKLSEDENNSLSENIPLSSVGTGFLQVLQILSYINVYKPRLLFLDEPDSHLHPDIQKKLIEVITELSIERKFQIIIATHSTHVLNSIIERSGAIYHVDADSEGGCVAVENYNHINVLMDLGALDIYQKLGKDNLDFVVFTEDGAVKDLAGRYKPKKDYLRPIIDSSLLDEDMRYEILSYRGCGNIDNATLLAEIIRMSTSGTKVIIHRDRDFLPEEEIKNFENRCRKAGIIPFVTSGADIESYYLDKEHLLNSLSLEKNELEDIFDKMKRSRNMESIINKIANDRIDYIRSQLSLSSRVNSSSPEVLEFAQRMYYQNPDDYIYGKKDFGNLVNILGQHRIKDILTQSPYITVDVFRNL